MAFPRKNNRSIRSAPEYLISACLVGVDCTYNGVGRLDPTLKRLAEGGAAIAICPEMLGGSPARRPSCEISGGDGHDVISGKAIVLTKDGADITSRMIKGAGESLAIARRFSVRKAILKSKSPSCGIGCIHDGTFRGILKKGDGVTAALFIQSGIKVFDERGYGHG